MRANLYEAGKTVLRYEDLPGSPPLPLSSREIIFGPLHSESSNNSEGSQETGDSGNYSNEESNEDNPTTSQNSRTEPLGSDKGNAVSELQPPFKVKNEEMRGGFHHSTLDKSCNCSS